MKKNILKFITFFLPFSLFFQANDNLIYLMYSGIFLFLSFSGYYFIGNIRKYEISKGIAMYFMFILFSLLQHCFFSVDGENSITMIGRLAVICLVIFFVYNNVKIYGVEKAFLAGLSAGLIINLSVILHVMPAWMSSDAETRFSGVAGNENVFSNMVLMSIVAISYFRLIKGTGSWLYTFALISGFICLLFAGSRAGIIGGIFVLTVLGISWILNPSEKKDISYGILFLLFLTIVFIPLYADFVVSKFESFLSRFQDFISFFKTSEGDRSTEMRYMFAELAFELIGKYFFTGVGLDNFKFFTVTYSHNNYLEIFVSVGVFGFLIYLSFYYVLLSKILKIKGTKIKFILFFLFFVRFILDITIVSYYLRLVVIIVIFLEVLIDKEDIVAKRNRYLLYVFNRYKVSRDNKGTIKQKNMLHDSFLINRNESPPYNKQLSY